MPCLPQRGRALQSVSLRLGCVRLTERFVADPARPFTDQAFREVSAHVQAVLGESGFAFRLQPRGPRSALAAPSPPSGPSARVATACPGQQTDPEMTVAELRRLLAETGSLPSLARRGGSRSAPARADVFPAALATLLAMRQLGRLRGYRHSLYNLRWGLAAACS